MTRKLLCSLLVVVAATSPAFADEKGNKAKAKSLYDEGLKHYNVAEWPEAIKAWKESYLLSKKPLLLFNIGQAYRLSGDCKQAQTFYDSYQREEPNPKNQSELDEAIALCAKQGDKPATGTGATSTKPTTGTTTVTTNPGIKPTTGTTTTGATTTGATTTGTTTTGATTTGTTTTGTAITTTKPDTSKGATTGPTVAQGGDAEQHRVEPIDGPQTTGGGLRKIGIGVGGAGVVMVGLGVYFGLGARKASRDLDGYAGEWDDAHQQIEDRGKREQKFMVVFTGAGAVAAIAGGVMFAIGGPKTTESSTVTIVPTSGGAAIGWAGRF